MFEAQTKGHWWWCWTPRKEKDIGSTCWHALIRGTYSIKNVFFRGVWIALIKPSIVNFLPYELLFEIGLLLDIEELKTVILVCRLFCDIYLPIYLSRYKFTPGRRCFSLYKVQDFDAFRLYHRSQNLPLHASLSAFFNEIDSNIQAKSLAYALAHLPTKTFTSVNLWVARHSPLGPQSLSELLTALVPMQCSTLSISACLEDQHQSDISIAPIFTLAPMAFRLTNLKLDGDLNTTFYQPLLLCTASSLELLTLLSFNGNPNYMFPADGWNALLGSGEFPRLRQLKVSNDIPFSLLLDFLSHHSGIATLAIEADAGDRELMHDTTQEFNVDAISAISGSPQYIVALLRRASRRPSLSRLSLYASHLPNSSIVEESLKCLALCQRVDAFEVSLPHSNCQIAFHAVDKLPQLDYKMLGIKRFRIMFLDFTDFSSDNTTVSNGNIVVSTLLFCLFVCNFKTVTERMEGMAQISLFCSTFWIGRNVLDARSQWSLQSPIWWIPSPCCICPLGYSFDRKPNCKGLRWLWLPRNMKYIVF